MSGLFIILEIKCICHTYNKNKLHMKTGDSCEIIIVYDGFYCAAGNLWNHKLWDPNGGQCIRYLY